MADSRVPPHDLDAEAAVVSAMLLDLDAARAMTDALAPGDFYSPANRRVFEACGQVLALGKPVDVITVGAHLKGQDRLAEIGGVPYLAYLADAVPSVANLDAYAEIVRQKAAQRTTIAVAQRVAAEGYGDVGDPLEWASRAATEIADLAQGRRAARSVSLRTALIETFQDMVAAAERGGAAGYSTGFEDLDALTGGFFPSELVVVAGRPGMGKSALVGGACVGAALAKNETFQAASLIVSLEMPYKQIALRLLCAEAGVSISDLRQGRVRSSDVRWGELARAIEWLQHLPVHLYDKPSTLAQIRAEARRFKAEIERTKDPSTGLPRKLALVAVDYISLVDTGEAARRGGTREQEVAGVSKGLIALAKELDVAVIALAQLNRQVEARPDKRPMMSDLRESGQIEQDANLILMVYRDEVYNPGGVLEDGRPNTGIAEVVIAKQRNGAVGTVELAFDGPTTYFKNLPTDKQARAPRAA